MGYHPPSCQWGIILPVVSGDIILSFFSEGIMLPVVSGDIILSFVSGDIILPFVSGVIIIYPH
jgi:hypothetical protein